MAFPFLSESGFESGGTLTTAPDHWAAVSPSPFTRASFAHYSGLAAVPGLPAPYRGAFAFAINLGPNTTDHYVREDTAWDVAFTTRQFFRFNIFVSADTVMANNDEFALLQIRSAAAVEAAVVLNFTTANGFRIGFGQTGGTNFLGFTLGAWHSIELNFLCSTAVTANGTIDLTVDGGPGTQITGITNLAVTEGRVGVMSQDAGTTRGWVVIDDVMSDDLTMPVPSVRWPTSVLLTTTGHAFVGHGCITWARLMSGAATDNVVSIFDSDVGSTDASKLVLELKNTANSQLVDGSMADEIYVTRGCFVTMSGTNPRALIDIEPGAAFGSDGAVRNYGVGQPRRST